MIKCNDCLTGNLYEDVHAYVFEAKVNTFFHETQFFERMTATQTMTTQTWVFGRHFLENR